MSLLSRQRQSVPTTVDRLREEFDRMLHNWWSENGDFDKGFGGAGWQPSVDICERDEGIEVKVDLPGVKPEDVEISVANDRLTIKGQREEEKKSTEDKVHRVERSFGSFYRSIDLPSGTKADDVTAEADNGVITIHFPKPAVKEASRIPVKPK